MLDSRVKKRFTVTMKNRDGEKQKIESCGYNGQLAEHQATEDANNGLLRGTGWIAINHNEIAQ